MADNGGKIASKVALGFNYSSSFLTFKIFENNLLFKADDKGGHEEDTLCNHFLRLKYDFARVRELFSAPAPQIK